MCEVSDMRLMLASTTYMDLPLEKAIQGLRNLRVSSIELPVDKAAAMLDVNDLLDANRRSEVLTALRDAGFTPTVLANHGDGQLLLGPFGPETDGFYRGSPAEKQAFAIERMKNTARAADAVGVRTVSAFIGCPDYTHLFHWPAYSPLDRHFEKFCEVMHAVLPVYREYGVRFAHELHPKQLVYDHETAARSLEAVGEFEEWGFNVDTANLALCGVDAASFISAHRERIWYMHAKDIEMEGSSRHLFAHHAREHGWRKGYRFRVPGWGEIQWRKLFTTAHCCELRNPIAVETEDETIGRWEGARLGLEFIRHLMLHEPREPRWW